MSDVHPEEPACRNFYLENTFYPRITQIFADFFCFYRENALVLRTED